MNLTTKIIVIAAFSMITGCVNIYTRNPITDTSIEACYQSTDLAIAATLFCSFPQMMKLRDAGAGLEWYNCLTIPFLGLPCAIDSICECALDTVFYPADYLIAKKRHPKRMAEDEIK